MLICIIGTEKYPDNGKVINYDDDFSQGYGQIKEALRNLTKDPRHFTASQPIEVEFKFDGVVSKDINGYALVLTNKLVSISSDGQRHVDLISVQLLHDTITFCHC